MRQRITPEQRETLIVTERGSVATLEGAKWGFDAVSFAFSESNPGDGARPHSHPYQEVFIVTEGQVAFTIGDTTVQAATGDVVIVPPEAAHAFLNTGSEILRMVGVHQSPIMRSTNVAS